jgi:rare lipoprotein A
MPSVVAHRLLLLGMVLLSLALVQGCSSQIAQPSEPNAGRYSQKYDSIPSRLPSPEELQEPQPKTEVPSRQGNRDYQLFGQTWRIIPDARGYRATGTASWYGEKFHGHLTSNGETYDMYSMSAAHKTLPLPTYVRVTNVANQRSVVVRVNDRGPFHGDRLIDLSYVAAYKLGMLATGTAQVEIEALHPDADQLITTPLAAAEPRYYLQVHASRDLQRLQQEAHRLAEIYHVPATTQPNDGLHRLLLGPFGEAQAAELIERLKADGLRGVFRLQVP